MSNKTQLKKEELDISDIPIDLIERFNLSGVYRGWHENGVLSWERLFKNGVRHGVYSAWHENGAPRWEDHYKNGRLHGVAMDWHANGALWFERHFKNGVRIK